MNTILTDDERPKLPPAKNYLGDDASWGYDASDMEAYANEREAAVLAKLREQEPRARVELIKTGGNAGLSTRIVELDHPLRERLTPGTKLYAAPLPAEVQVPQGFTDWLCREIPPGTVISDPAWWAPRIARAMLAAAPEAPAQTGVQVPELMKRVQSVTDNTLTRSGFFDAIAAAPEAPAQAAPSAGEVWRDRKDAERWREWIKGKALTVVVSTPTEKNPASKTTIFYAPSPYAAFADAMCAAIDAAISHKEQP